MTRKSQREHCANCSWLHQRDESLREIHARAPSEAAEDPACLVPRKRPFCLELVLEDPLPGNNIGPCRTRHKIPAVILQQSIMFLHHSYLPIGISQSAAVGLQFGRQSGGM